MSVFKISISILLIVFSGVSHASSLPGLESAYVRLLSRTQMSIESQKLNKGGKPNNCHQQVMDMRADGRLDITAAFGYMDVSGGQDFNDSGNHLYGQGNVLDLDAKNALKTVLTSNCIGNMSACGFRASGDTLTKNIRDRWSNQNIKVTVRLAAPAVTGSNQLNTGKYAGNQQQSSARAKNVFLSGLQNSDATIYMGHARSGGGPDFLPPVLNSNGHVVYSQYKSQQTGIRSMLGALKQAGSPSPVIAVLACKSTRLFAGSIQKQAPRSLLITADDLFDYNDILPTGFAVIEGLVGQRCSDEFSKIVKVRPASKSFLKIFY